MDKIMDIEALQKLLDEAPKAPWRVLDETDCHCDDDGNIVSMAIGKDDYQAFALAMHPWSDRSVDAIAGLIALAPILARRVIAADKLAAELRNLLAAYAEPERQICCSGSNCGCRGSSTWQQAEHFARESISEWEEVE